MHKWQAGRRGIQSGWKVNGKVVREITYGEWSQESYDCQVTFTFSDGSQLQTSSRTVVKVERVAS